MLKTIERPGGSMSYVAGLPNNSYKPLAMSGMRTNNVSGDWFQFDLTYIFCVLTSISAIFQLYHGDQY
jgi:hypothetical protein